MNGRSIRDEGGTVATYAALGSVAEVLADLPWPVDFFSADDLPGFLNKLIVLDYSFRNTPTGYEGWIWLAFEKELSIDIPGLEGVSIVFGENKDDLTFVKLHVSVGDTNEIKIVDTEMALRYEGSLLTPVPTEDDPHPDAVEITYSGTIVIDDSFNVTFEDFDSVDLSPAMIGQTGIIISAKGVELDFSRTESSSQVKAAGYDDSFLGVFIGEASVQLPDGYPAFAPKDLVLKDCAIGTGGVSGSLKALYPDQYYDVPTQSYKYAGGGEFFGVPFAILSADIEFHKGAFKSSEIKGRMYLPFFEVEIDVDVALQLDGGFTIGLTGALGSPILHVDKTGLFALDIDNLKFRVDAGTLTTILSGTITPEVGSFDWPAFRVNELEIDSDGHVRLDGGWLDLPDQYDLAIGGFHMEITKLGFGKTDDGTGKWIGFSGGITLIDGMQAGASVDGLRVTWYPDGTTHITCDGVGVEFEIPDTLRFKGSVDYHAGATEDRFEGQIELDLLALDMQLDGKLVFGSVAATQTAAAYRYGALFLSLDVPAGIPLLSTGLAIYGFAGLLGLHVEPDKASDRDWYRIDYAAHPDWYHLPTVGVAEFSKWRSRDGSYALGAGITLGTAGDNGHAFAGRFLLVVVLPGPILLVQGAANILKDRAALADSAEPEFRALAVLDGRAGTFQFGMDAHYTYDSSGALIDLRANADVFFSFHDPSLWHVYLGLRTPEDLRIRATLASLFQANAYFMLDARQLATGAWVGYSRSWKFGPASVSVEAWMAGDAVISWRPPHVYGRLCLHGSVSLKVYRFGVGLTVDACLAADIFKPFDLNGDFTVSIDLPRPLHDLSFEIHLEWGPDSIAIPAAIPQLDLPAPLKEVAIEHFKVSTSWPLVSASSEPSVKPIVPLDCRPHLTFERPTNDDALVGMNGQAVQPEWEPVGDPNNQNSPILSRYSLEEVVLNQKTASGWVAVARKGKTANAAGLPTLFGSWAPMPAMPDGTGVQSGQTKLWLWSRTPFDYTSRTGGAWADGFTGRFRDYPHCGPAAKRVVCGTFETVVAANLATPPLACPGVPGLTIGWGAPPELTTIPVVSALTQALRFPALVLASNGTSSSNVVTFTPPAGTTRMTLLVGDDPETCVDFRGRPASGSLANAYLESGATFLTLAGTSPASSNAIVLATTTTGLLSGLDARTELDVTLPAASSFMELVVTAGTPPATVQAFGPSNNNLGTVTLNTAHHQTTVRFTHGPVARAIIRTTAGSGTVLHEVCFDGLVASPARATAVDVYGQTYGPFLVLSHSLDTGALPQDLASLTLTSTKPTCLLQACVTLPADPANLTPEQIATQHLLDERARWTQVAPILEPHTVYRLDVHTRRYSKGQGSYASGGDDRPFSDQFYFQTDGPPALARLSIPDGIANPTEMTRRDDQGNPIAGVLGSALDTLSPYVEQTIPFSVPAVGEKPVLLRPVYRAYDVGVQFNEDYVDLMYRADRRDLGLYLYDVNRRPVRDAQGRLIVLTNRWGRSETLELDPSEQRWVTLFNGSQCLPGIDPSLIPTDVGLKSAGDGLVLDPDTVYEGRLSPLLVHEDFSTAAVGASANAGAVPLWTVIDEADPSSWVVAAEGTPTSQFIMQTSLAGGGTTSASDPIKPGTLLVRVADTSLTIADPNPPSGWTDYRFTVTLRTGATGAIGVVFRFRDAGHCYRFSIDRSLGYRRLVRIGSASTSGDHFVLAEDAGTLAPGFDAVVTVEAVGDLLRVYQDGVLVFDVTDATFASGGIGLYAWKNSAARFSEIRIDDFGATAVVAYHFPFTTSQFAKFLDHLHSFQDETWDLDFATDPGVVTAAAASADPSSATTDAESRAYAVLANAVLGSAAQQNPARLEVTRILVAGALRGFLCRGPEPIDWERTSLAIDRAPMTRRAPALPPGTLKLIGATFTILDPSDETVSLVLRSNANPSGSRVELLLPPGPLAEPIGATILTHDEFIGPDSGRLYTENFGPNSLDHYVIAEQGAGSGQGHWTAASGAEIAQTLQSGAAGSSFASPQVLASSDVRVRVDAKTDGGAGFGIALRYADGGNHYRFVLDSAAGKRSIVAVVAGVVQPALFEEAFTVVSGHVYRFEVDASGDALRFTLDDVLVAVVHDGRLSAGDVALYSDLAAGAHFTALSIESQQAPAVPYESVFADSNEFESFYAFTTTDDPPLWILMAGVLTQTSAAVSTDPGVIDGAAAFAVLTSPAWTDADVCVRLKSDGPGFLGVGFRWNDIKNSYRFSLNTNGGQALLLKVVEGVTTSLQSATVAFSPGVAAEVRIRTEGPNITIWVDGQLLFAVIDSAFPSGQVALFCGGNPTATFERVVVVDRTRRVGTWTIVDEGATGAPSIWTRHGDVLRQTSSITGTGNTLGTAVLQGDATWTDYRITASLRTIAGAPIGLVFRYGDRDDYYRLSVNAAASALTLVRKSGGTFTVLWSDTVAAPIGTSFELRVDVLGNRLVGHQDGSPLFDLTDPTLTSGGAGLWCAANPGAFFERIDVRTPSVESYALLADRFLFGDTTGWTFLSGGTVAVAGSTSWTDVVLTARVQLQAADVVGVRFRYQDESNYYAFTLSPTGTTRRLIRVRSGVVTELWSDAASLVIGRPYAIAVTCTGATVRCWIDRVPVVTVEDAQPLLTGEVGLSAAGGSIPTRFADVTVYDSGRQFARWLLDDPFDELTPGRWTIYDLGDVNFPSEWSVLPGSGVLSQTSAITSGSPGDSGRRGTYALTGDSTWVDYRVAVRLEAARDGDLGVVFRFVDVSHHYLFTLSRDVEPGIGHRRLISVVDGEPVVLAEDTGTYPLNREVAVAVDAVGSTLRAFVDGVLVFEVSDSSHAAGGAGLYTSADPGAEFTEARVAPYEWSTYYEFAGESILAGGTLILLSSGSAEAAAAAALGVQPRFVALEGERGRTLFPPAGIDLRVVGDGEQIEHTATFVPDASYTPANLYVLRRADGTEFALVNSDGSVVPGDEHRLSLTYRRDNRTAQPGSLVFTENGDSTAEQVTLHVPGAAI